MYRPPIRTRGPIRSPFQPRTPLLPQAEDPVTVALGHKRIADIVSELEALLESARNSFEAKITELESMAEQKLNTLNTKVEAAHHTVKKAENLVEQAKMIKKGDKGDKPIAGVDYEIPVPKAPDAIDYEKIVAEALKRIPPQKKGKNIDVDALMGKILLKFPFAQGTDKAEINIEKLAETVAESKKLKVENVQGVETAMENYLKRFGYKPYIHGGGDTVAAGSNITLVRNSNGTVTISSSGGSGFTELTATETPNGVRTVFTFAAAAAQPSYIVVDNVWMKATSKAGTVNWTWNAGAKQATLTIPATDDIFGIV